MLPLVEYVNLVVATGPHWNAAHVVLLKRWRLTSTVYTNHDLMLDFLCIINAYDGASLPCVSQTRITTIPYYRQITIKLMNTETLPRLQLLKCTYLKVSQEIRHRSEIDTTEWSWASIPSSKMGPEDGDKCGYNAEETFI